MAVTLTAQGVEKNNHNITEYSRVTFSTTDTQGTFTTTMKHIKSHSIGVFGDGTTDDQVKLNEQAHCVSGNIEVVANTLTIVRNGSSLKSGLLVQIACVGY